MLKIKDDVDLKELKKYGFDEDYCLITHDEESERPKGQSSVEVDPSTKEITVYYENYFSSGIDQYVTIDVLVLFDLIADGLVEKIE